MFFKERWYGFDDGLYAGARMIEILSRQKMLGHSPSQVLDRLPDSFSTPELQVKLADGENVALIDQLQRIAATTFEPARCRQKFISSTAYGLNTPMLWPGSVLNTTPVIVLRFEGDDVTALTRIQADFRSALSALKPDIELPF